MVEASARNKSGWEDSNSDVSLFPVDGVEVDDPPCARASSNSRMRRFKLDICSFLL